MRLNFLDVCRSFLCLLIWIWEFVIIIYNLYVDVEGVVGCVVYVISIYRRNYIFLNK